MSSNKSNTELSPESIHDAWLQQRAELEHELFDGWLPELRANSVSVGTHASMAQVPSSNASTKAASTNAQLSSTSSEPIGAETPKERVDTDKAQHGELQKRANESAARQRVEHQQRVTETLSQQRETFFQDLARQRAAFEQELASRESAWSAQRDQEWTALRTAKEVHDVAQLRLKDELAAQRVREREELLQWRRQAETEFAEARRLFEQERLNQQQEFSRQREAEVSRLRREREEFDLRVRQVHAELALARQRQEEELRQARDLHTAQMRAERTELESLRETWLDKFRREQVVLENGLQFFGQHLSRVSEELRVAQRGLQAVSESATEANPIAALLPATAPVVQDRPPEPILLSLDQIRDRLNELKKPLRDAA